jgi:hypothetical protein
MEKPFSAGYKGCDNEHSSLTFSLITGRISSLKRSKGHKDWQPGTVSRKGSMLSRDTFLYQIYQQNLHYFLVP